MPKLSELAFPPNVVFLSPHFDDVALSCGGTAALVRGALCLTIFSGTPAKDAPLGEFARRLHEEWGASDVGEILERRSREDQEAARLLGMGRREIGYLDAIYRGDRYPGGPPICRDLHPDDLVLCGEIATRLEETLPARGETVVVAPLGIGGHVDHEVTHRAGALLSSSGWRVLFYEDFPYADENWGPYRYRPLPPAYDRRTRDGFSPVYVDVDATIRTRVAATLAYESQLGSLFEGEDGAQKALMGYAMKMAAEGHQTAQFAERFWKPLE
jgi:LmbE family N-acetylglucosaminyl deacetylase